MVRFVGSVELVRKSELRGQSNENRSRYGKNKELHFEFFGPKNSNW
jgi:hypothetical protein